MRQILIAFVLFFSGIAFGGQESQPPGFAETQRFVEAFYLGDVVNAARFLNTNSMIKNPKLKQLVDRVKINGTYPIQILKMSGSFSRDKMFVLSDIDTGGVVYKSIFIFELNTRNYIYDIHIQELKEYNIKE